MTNVGGGDDEPRQPEEIREGDESFAVTVERTGRGSYATVTDAGSPFDGESVFASIPSVAFALLLDKVSQLKAERMHT